MIFVTLGTQKFQMNRLVEAVDRMAPSMDEEIFIQLGNSTYQPVHCQAADFVDKEQFKQLIKECTLLITHAGIGTIMMGINETKPIIVVPRRAEYQEHVDNHQEEIAEAFASKNHVMNCSQVNELPKYIEKARHSEFSPYIERGEKMEDIVLNFVKSFE